ncbi:MAG: hypothetical protein IPK97_14820 [Ahniella sp.]|nr:hypothetical protein [Ahniella sp.]
MSFPKILNHRLATAIALGSLLTVVGSNATLAAPMNLSKVPLFINSRSSRILR